MPSAHNRGKPCHNKEAISQLLHGNKELHPPANAKNESRLKDFGAECKRAADDPERFWAETAFPEKLPKTRSGKMLAFFLVGGSLGTIVMRWIAYSAIVGSAL